MKKILAGIQVQERRLATMQGPFREDSVHPHDFNSEDKLLAEKAEMKLRHGVFTRHVNLNGPEYQFSIKKDGGKYTAYVENLDKAGAAEHSSKHDTMKDAVAALGNAKTKLLLSHRKAHGTSLEEWKTALKNDEISLKHYEQALHDLEAGKTLGEESKYLSAESARKAILSLKAVIHNKKEWLKSQGVS